MFSAIKYIERIGSPGTANADYETLCKLVRSHVFHVPFENLDISLGKPIILELDKIYNKIVLNNRGGFCYELNGLFYKLLRTIGYDVKMVSARVHEPEHGYGQEFDHMALIVNLENQKLLVDVGFGEFSILPLDIDNSSIADDGKNKWMITQPNSDQYISFKLDGSGRKPQYLFSLKERKLDDFAEMCHYHQTNPDSHFTDKRLITIQTETGRYTISGDKIKISTPELIKETEIESNEHFESLLIKYFNVKLL